MARLDRPLLLAALFLAAVGLLNVYSGTRAAAGHAGLLFVRQALWLGLGTAVFFAVYLLGDGALERAALPAYGASLFLLAAVLAVGTVRGGAQRWVSLGGFNVQPSEFAKVALVLALAKVFAERYHPGTGIGLRDLLPAGALAVPPFVLVALQPDLGTAGMFAIILAGMAVAACVRRRVLLLLGAAGAAAVPCLWFVMKDYQRQRVLTFLDPERDPLGAGYHVIQSKIAVGSGGIVGKGYLKGTQGALRFLPEQHTDFAFAVFAEEWGFLGAAVLLALFFFLVHRCLVLAEQCQNRFASFACAGVTVYFAAHAVINVAMVCGLFPVVGIPLPFVSYGGSSMVTNMAALGIVANLSRSRFTFQGAGRKTLDA